MEKHAMEPSVQKRATGAKEIVRFLEDHGYGHMFGLPGSSMVATLYEMQESSVQYVPTIHESVTIAAADGYARVKGKACASIYMAPGTANALANLYNAWWAESPILVMASQLDSTERSAGSNGMICEGDTVQIVKPFTRLAHELGRDMVVRPWLERAHRAATSMPKGPAFLSICEDVYEREGPVEDVPPPYRAPSRTADVSAIVTALATAERPLIVVGSQLRQSGGAALVEALSDRYEIPVGYDGGFQAGLGVGPGRARTVGTVMGRGVAFQNEADVVVLIGANLFADGKRREKPWFSNAKFIAQANADPKRIEHTQFANWTSVCDPAAFAEALLEGLAAEPPRAELQEKRGKWIKSLVAAAREPRPQPTDATGLAFANYAKGASYVRDALNQGWVVDESVMATPMIIDAQNCEDGRRYCGAPGGSLGWATGAAAGVAIASNEPVTCVVGDGSLRFGVHGLWTIAALNLPITIVVLDNGGYGSTRFFEREYIARRGIETNLTKPSYYNMDLRSLGPSVASVIRGFGIDCTELSPEDDVDAALKTAWAARGKGPNAVIIPIGFEGY
ncbi:hypothetical protein BSL82_11960 [Tardibacter chloracetimidivorans]|uniref:Thiamine pyrophosphate-binding protein n=1 Tax=Tardibacter chloracetimidivorans TaxID=1921510 RepID=A0A1L3ZWC6_9SPHN|nr:thiamine pyrophosphate-binding protein [Tardibacter chloracetimidivorans]API59936.1 hypothetical protein BSL82_11960 [Tardibacter chloracetimidivorans]